MRKFFLILPLSLALVSCGGKKVATKAPTSNLDKPDKVLFDRASHDLDKNKFTVSRLTLQTLINTYPDSEFLPQAKYLMAESFYRENSSSSLNQAETEFKDYITFFPTSPLADDAQMKIAMTHVRRLEKPDRDNTQAQLAELEFKSFIEMYPDSQLLTEAKEKLRAVQEILADGEDKIGDFYFLHKVYPAALNRYKAVVTRYPDYSKLPDTLFNLAESLRHSGNEEESAIYYARIVIEHPLSQKVADAKRHLTAMNQPIPEPNPVALARAQQAPREDKNILGKMFGILRSRPPVPTETGAANSAVPEEQPTDTAPAPVRGGVTASPNTNSGGSGNGNGGFSVTPANKTPAKKP